MIGIKATGSNEILGVGRCAVASADMKRSRKGKAVEMIHCWKDRCDALSALLDACGHD